MNQSDEAVKQDCESKAFVRLAAKITLNAKSKTLTVGKSFQLKVKSVKPTKASKAVTYKSRNKSVATVSSKGKIVAKKAGKTTITVTNFVHASHSKWPKSLDRSLSYGIFGAENTYLSTVTRPVLNSYK